MSHKHDKKKLLKQLIDAQIRASQQALEGGKAIPVAPPSPVIQTKEESVPLPPLSVPVVPIVNTASRPTTPTALPTAPSRQPEKLNELALIKKDIRFDMLVMSFIVLAFALIYVLDSKYGFLLKIADWLFALWK